MMALSAAIEPMRAANRLLGRRRYLWTLVGEKAANMIASNGIELRVPFSIKDVPSSDMTVVLASLSVEEYQNAEVFSWLRTLKRSGRLLGAISNGSLVLARAGVAHNTKLTIHWEMATQLSESFPDIAVSSDLYCWDKGILTAAGGTAALDMMLALISEMDGASLAMDVADQFLHGQIRPSSQFQRQDLQSRFSITDDRVLAAIEIFERNIASPTKIAAVASKVGISERQLERLFIAQVDMPPAAFYLHLRLIAARRMIIASTEALEAIAERCGFSSLGHFSRAFKAKFRASPSQLRRHKPHSHDGFVQGTDEAG